MNSLFTESFFKFVSGFLLVIVGVLLVILGIQMTTESDQEPDSVQSIATTTEQ